MEINYEERYNKLIGILGYEPELIEENDAYNLLEKAATILSKVRVAMLTDSPEKTGALFITGIDGDKDEMGLPEKLYISPTYGLEGTATYTKTSDYSRG
jgi:hypothetical protein